MNTCGELNHHSHIWPIYVCDKVSRHTASPRGGYSQIVCGYSKDFWRTRSSSISRTSISLNHFTSSKSCYAYTGGDDIHTSLQDIAIHTIIGLYISSFQYTHTYIHTYIYIQINKWYKLTCSILLISIIWMLVNACTDRGVRWRRAVTRLLALRCKIAKRKNWAQLPLQAISWYRQQCIHYKNKYIYKIYKLRIIIKVLWQ